MGPIESGAMIYLLLTVAFSIPSPPPGLRIEGTFIQLNDAMARRTTLEWKRELDAARRAGLKTVIIQRLRTPDADYMNAPRRPVETILWYADEHGMTVFLGLTEDPRWWSRCTDPEYLTIAADAAVTTAEAAWQRYRRHRSFVGWYIAHEFWDLRLSETQTAALRGFYRSISDRCRSLAPGKSIATAPFFTGEMPPTHTARVFQAILDGSGIDIVMVQDGVGARGWDREVEVRIAPYFSAIRDACVAAGVELWSDLECFRLRGTPAQGFVPADPPRVLRQLAAASPFVKRFVTFDFFHYMSPTIGGAARELYDGYIAGCVDRPFMPAIGRSMQIDPAFRYYRDRSPSSIADEIRAAGYSIVEYIVVNDRDIDDALVRALTRRHIGVWYLTFGNGVYRTEGLPAGWRSWKMVTRADLAGKSLEDGYTRLCLNNPGYRKWKKDQIVQSLTRHPFLGVQIAEPHWPEYPGIASPAYGCFCRACRDAFRERYGSEAELPDIIDPTSPQHPDRDPALWKKWLAFRQATLTAFLDDIVNGVDGIRSRAPDARVCTWSLGLMEADGVARVRDIHGEDAGEIVRVVKPDVHCLQTHWPDWIQAELPGDYIRAYQPFLDQIRQADASIPIVFQADIGSQPQNRRSTAWIERFERTALELGAHGSMCYEYFIGSRTYEDPPKVVETVRDGPRVRLLFTKRLDPATASEARNYEIEGATVRSATVDGSVVTLQLTKRLPDRPVSLTILRIQDAEDRRLFRDKPAAILDHQRIRIAR